MVDIYFFKHLHIFHYLKVIIVSVILQMNGKKQAAQGITLFLFF